MINAVKKNQLFLALSSGFYFSKEDVEILDSEGFSPIYYAAKNMNKKFCEFLIEKGADINKICKDGSTSVHAAFSTQNIPVYF